MGMGNMGKMLKQVQEMQAKMAKLQEQLGEVTVEASAGGGAVVVTVNGKQELVSIRISPEAIDPEDVEMLEDMVKAAVNDGLKKAQDHAAAEMSKITGGLKVPGLF